MARRKYSTSSSINKSLNDKSKTLASDSDEKTATKAAKKFSKKSALDLSSGEIFAKRYKIIAEMSRSELGRIYKAEDIQSNKIVALRIFNPEMSDNEWMDIIQKLREKEQKKKEKAETSQELPNGSFTKLYNIGRAENIKYLSMQFTEEKSTSRIATATKMLLYIFAAAIVVLIGVVIFYALINKPTEIASITGPGKKSIAIMYFENNTGDKNLDHWREALSDLLITDLAQSRYIRVLSEKQLFHILKELKQLETTDYSFEVLQQVAEKGKVEFILLGSLNKAGEHFRIDIKIQEAKTAELLGSEIVKGEGEESIFAMVDELTKKIKLDFQFPEELIANDIDKEIGKITTSSPEAYKYYIIAMKYYSNGNYRQCIQMMEKAIAIDPEFAMAYRAFAMSYDNLGYESETKKYIQKALKLVDRVSDRECYLIQADAYRRSEKTWDKAIEAYNKLLNLYPDDLTGNNNLGILLIHTGEWDKAIKRFDICIKNKDEDVFAYTNQALVYIRQGIYDNAKKAIEYYLANFSDNSYAHNVLGYIYLIQKKYDIALSEAEKAITLNPNDYENHELIGDIYQISGDFTKAKNSYSKMLESEEPIAHLSARIRLGALYILQAKFEKAKNQFTKGSKEAKTIGEIEWESGFHSLLAYIHRTTGNNSKALSESTMAFELAIQTDFQYLKRNALYCKGLSLLNKNSFEEASITAERLKKLIETGMHDKRTERYNYHLKGLIELKKNNFSPAINNFNKAISLLPAQNSESWAVYNRHAAFLDSLARAYYLSGNIEKARIEYEKINNLTMGRLMYGDIYARSYYMLGKIYQQTDWKCKAIENYQTFLNLWKDADANIPEIKDAKKQLSLLQPNP